MAPSPLTARLPRAIGDSTASLPVVPALLRALTACGWCSVQAWVGGGAVAGLVDLVRSAGATVEGVGIAVEKGFQQGGKVLREKGLQVESLAAYT